MEETNQRPWLAGTELPVHSAPLRAGTLYLVATPIGNLEDITLRALRTLGEVDAILCEDTRHSGRLLKAYGIRKPLISLHKFNERRREAEILERLSAGETLALITDAGTPGISDPGGRLVGAVWSAGLRVEALPGACAAVVALASSGFFAPEFHFVGFLPVKSGQRGRELERLRELGSTLVFYESPYRVVKLLGELEQMMPEREIVLFRELTKKFEEACHGSAADLRARFGQGKPRGEFVVVVGPAA